MHLMRILSAVSLLLVFGTIFEFIGSAHAYIGPGVAGGVILAVFGFLAALLLALFAVIYYPIKRAVQNFRAGQKSSSRKTS